MIVETFPQPVSQLAPHVEVTVDQVPAGAETVSVVRGQERRTFDTRGLVDRSVYSDLWVRDFEAPYGAAAVYTATAYDRAGQPIESASSSEVRLRSVKASVVTMHDPVRPEQSMTVVLGKDAANGGTRALGGDVMSASAASVPIAVNTVRGGWTSLTLDLVTYQEAEAEKLDALFGGYDIDGSSGVICFRLAENTPSLYPRTFFGRVTAPEPRWWPGGDGNGNRRADWRVTAIEVQPPSPALVEPIVSWADWQAWMAQNFGWEGFARTFPTFADANRTLIPYGWANRPVEPFATWGDWEAWLADNGGWAGFNATFPTWAAAMKAREPMGWADR